MDLTKLREPHLAHVHRIANGSLASSDTAGVVSSFVLRYEKKKPGNNR
jgi:hypothetical protein